MTTPLKIGIAIVFGALALIFADWLYEFINPWAGIAALVLTILGALQFFGLVNLKKIIFAIAAVSVVASCVRVDPSYEGVLMTNCGKNGLDDFKIVSGKVNTAAVCKDLFQVPMFEQKGDLEPVNLLLSDGTTGFSVDPSYRYVAIRGQGPNIIYKYKQFAGADDMLESVEDNILDLSVLEAYREEARKYTADDLLNNMTKFEEAVKNKLVGVFEKAHFTLIDVTSSLTPPQSLIESIEARNKEISDSKREEERLKREMLQMNTEREKARMQVEINRLKAQADIERSKGLTPEVLEEMKIRGWIENGSPVPNVVNGESFYNVMDSKPKRKGGN